MDKPLTPEEVRSLNALVSEAKNLDHILQSLLGKRSKIEPEIGELLKNTLGRNLMHGVPSDLIGNAAYVGVINGLLLARADVVKATSGAVQFQPPPCEVLKIGDAS